ncbi:TetR/AcrR family transcriptional regulator [Pigmentiphaga aceris]|uniref:TetR/AcrR family transcriptional regulator n=1 Tax=Pigmentiphaga aceris TaxID=1940612 RepID=A0A5C0B7Y9_9BURK|nr:TetR/AcrR family transcriptional regulator [Pigmentiphaga aceris]QEI08917.1 TetR/AcrR family transcriptional regulator [Pigmentiphaga aceris]
MAARGRPRAFDRDAALNAAMTLFWEKGFTATSMTDLCQCMGINSPSLYAAFGSKEALYAEAMAHYVESFSPQLWAPIEAAATAREGFEHFLTASAHLLTQETCPKGCMLTLSTVASEGVEDLGRLVVAGRNGALAALEARLRRAVNEGELPASLNVEGTARMFLGVQQGMSVQARDGASQAELEAMAEAAMRAWPGSPR